MKPVVKLLVSIFGGAALLAAIWICWVWKRTGDCQAAYLQVRRGDTPTRVVELCGQPGRVTLQLETNLSWEDSKELSFTKGRCVQQFYYYPPFSIVGESWKIGFDEQSNVVSKFHIISP